MNPPGIGAVAVSFAVTLTLAVSAITCSVWLTNYTLRWYREALWNAVAGE